MIDPLKVLRNPRLFLLYWTAMNGVEVDGGGNLKDMSGVVLAVPLKTMFLDYRGLLSEMSIGLPQEIKGFSYRELEMALDELIVKELITRRENGKNAAVDSIDEFIFEFSVMSPLPKSEKCLLPVSSVWPAYQSWCESKGLEVRSKWWLTRKINQSGVEGQLKKIGGNPKRVYVVGASCKLL